MFHHQAKVARLPNWNHDMQTSWTYKQLTAAAERELRALAAQPVEAGPDALARRAAVAHGMYMLWHNATTQCNVMPDRHRLRALAGANGALLHTKSGGAPGVTVQRDPSYRKAAIVRLDREPSEEDLQLIQAVLKRVLPTIHKESSK